MKENDGIISIDIIQYSKYIIFLRYPVTNDVKIRGRLSDFRQWAQSDKCCITFWPKVSTQKIQFHIERLFLEKKR